MPGVSPEYSVLDAEFHPGDVRMTLVFNISVTASCVRVFMPEIGLVPQVSAPMTDASGPLLANSVPIAAEMPSIPLGNVIRWAPGQARPGAGNRTRGRCG